MSVGKFSTKSRTALVNILPLSSVFRMNGYRWVASDGRPASSHFPVQLCSAIRITSSNPCRLFAPVYFSKSLFYLLALLLVSLCFCSYRLLCHVQTLPPGSVSSEVIRYSIAQIIGSVCLSHHHHHTLTTHHSNVFSDSVKAQ